jgi:uncharacterized protein YjbI with pentapeptide repeats
VANEEHLKILRQGVAAWNEWRDKNPKSRPDLSEANLHEVDLRGAFLDDTDLHHANLTKINLTHAFLHRADLCQADLTEATLVGTNFCQAQLRHATLINADLHRANLDRADLTEADLSGAKLERTILVGTTVSQANFKGCRVYGASAWDLVGMEKVKDQSDLCITRSDEPRRITVDDLEVAQFVYLLQCNKKIRSVIDTMTSKAVLILGRFSDERKPLLDAIRDELRKSEHNYVPIMFDFAPTTNQTLIETVTTLARIARFVIADVTDARSVLQELQAIVPGLPSVAVRLVIKKSEHKYGMLDFFRSYRSVIEKTYEYENLEELIASIKENVIGPAEAKVRELRQRN